MLLNKMNKLLIVFFVGLLVIGISSCHYSEGSENEHGTESSNEHKAKESNESGEKSNVEEGEEDGTQIEINETFEGVRNGVKMILAYDADKDAFIGTVENITEGVISQVRVEVHFSNSVELGPTPKADLAAGETRKISLSAEGNSFKTWSTHAESGNEKGHEGESEGEHR